MTKYYAMTMILIKKKKKLAEETPKKILNFCFF